MLHLKRMPAVLLTLTAAAAVTACGGTSSAAGAPGSVAESSTAVTEATTAEQIVGHLAQPESTTAVTAEQTTAFSAEQTTAPPAESTTAPVTGLTTAEPAKPGMSDAVLLDQAKLYYATLMNHVPEIAEIKEENGNAVTVRLADNRQTEQKELMLVTIDRVTGAGSTDWDTTFQLRDNQPVNDPLWQPDAKVYALVPEGCKAAVLYTGSQRRATETIDTETPMQYFVAHSASAKKYPFLKEIPSPQNVVWTENGSELWVILPKDPACTITVREIDPVSQQVRCRLTETYGGAPIILSCNYSDISPDVTVEIRYTNGETVTFSPYISARDGEPAATDESVCILN